MTYADLTCGKDGAVARIAFNRPARRNALGEATTRELRAACEEAIADDSVRVIVITGEGEAFCAGGDFRDTFERGAGKTEAEWRERIRAGPNGLVRCLAGSPKPVIASVNGAAVGGGATIALACDFRIASDRARFAFPFARLGLAPEFGCSRLLARAVGFPKATELLLTGDMIGAAEAGRIGLVNEVVPHDELAAATGRLAGRLAAIPPRATARIKSMLHRAQSMDLEAVLEMEAAELGAAFKTDEHREAVRAFLERKAAGRPGD
jgi:2-(1,2-epoxy-1,2-dihydrophenyl)acetyl-CoA isomerase